MIKWRFYINDIEVHEPKNWDSIKTKWGRNTEYWGLFEGASIEEVIFQNLVSRTLGNPYQILKDLCDASGVNAQATLRIDIFQGDDYEVYGSYEIDFSEYEEIYNIEDGIAVNVKVFSSDIWGKINERRSQKLVIGRDKDVFNETITGIEPVDVLFQELPLKLDSEQITGYDETMDGYNLDTLLKWGLSPDTRTSLGNMNDLEWVIPLTNVKKNIDWVNDTAWNKIKASNPNEYQQTVINLNFPPPTLITTDSHYAFEPFNVLMGETDKDFNVNLNFEITLQANYQNTGLRYIYLVEADYDGVEITNLNRIRTFSKNVILGFNTETFEGSFTFTKQANKIYYLSFATANNTGVVIRADFDPNTNTLIAPIDLGFITANVLIDTLDVVPASVHKAFSLKQCLTSLLRQMTGQNNILNSPLFNDNIIEPYCETEPFSFNNNTTDEVKIGDFDVIAPSTLRIDITYSEPTTESIFVVVCGRNNPSEIFGFVQFLSSATYTDEEVFITDDVLPVGEYSMYIFKESLPTTYILGTVTKLCFTPIDERTAFDNIYITNGLFLRNAESVDGVQPTLTLTFNDLWQTISAIYPLGLMVLNDMVYIDFRPNMFGVNEIELQPKSLRIRTAQEFYNTGIKVGNKRVDYEFLNGANEFNTLLEFSLPLKVKDRQFDLTTKINTDYLAFELARRLGWAKEQSNDTKYDSVNMMVMCEVVEGQVQTKRYTNVNNYVIDGYAYNVDFTPKRMLLRNSDIIAPSLWKAVGTEVVRFENIENVSNIDSDGIVERADVALTDLTTPLFSPIFYDVEVGEKDIYNVLKNKNNIFKFEYNSNEFFGYLWDADITGDIGTVTLLMRNIGYLYNEDYNDDYNILN